MSKHQIPSSSESSGGEEEGTGKMVNQNANKKKTGGFYVS